MSMGKYDGYDWIKVAHFEEESDLHMLSSEDLLEEYNRLRTHHQEETSFLVKTVREIDLEVESVRLASYALAADVRSLKREIVKREDDAWFAHEIASERMHESATRAQLAEAFISNVRKVAENEGEEYAWARDALAEYDEKRAVASKDLVEARHEREDEQIKRRHASELSGLAAKQDEEREKAGLPRLGKP
jgi:hypothetical protein